MNSLSPLALAYALLLGPDVPKESSAAAEVEQSLRSLNQAFAKQDVAALRRFFADDHVSITPYSGMMDRETHLKDLPAWKIAESREDDLKVTMLSKDTARATYQLTIRGTYRGKSLPARSL